MRAYVLKPDSGRQKFLDLDPPRKLVVQSALVEKPFALPASVASPVFGRCRSRVVLKHDEKRSAARVGLVVRPLFLICRMNFRNCTRAISTVRRSFTPAAVVRLAYFLKRSFLGLDLPQASRGAVSVKLFSRTGARPAIDLGGLFRTFHNVSEWEEGARSVFFLVSAEFRKFAEKRRLTVARVQGPN